MIKYWSNLSPHSVYGVSHNENGIIVCLETDVAYARVLISSKEAEHLIELLKTHIKQFKNKEWHGTPL